MSYCVRCTCRQHTCGWFSLQKTCSREFYREKNLYRGHQSKMVKCVCWRAELCLYPASLSLSLGSPSLLFSCSCVSSPVLQSRLWRFLSSFLQRDTVDVPRAKGNLFCTSSMHHVAASVDSTSRKCETGREGSLHKPNTVRPFSLLHLLQSGNTAGIRFSNGRVPRIWLLD